MGKVKALARDIVANWKTPPTGRYVSYKEIAAYSVGGMGMQFVMAMFYQVAMSANCWLIGSVFGIRPVHMTIVLTVASVIAIVFQPLKSWLIDSGKFKGGKSRPWIFWLGPPTVILVIAVAFIDKNWDYNVKLALIAVAYILLNILANFYYGMYGQLAQLITPNTDERAAIISVSSIINSLAPTITGAVIPWIASSFNDGLRDITVYRIAFPVFGILGVLLGYIAYFGTKEKVVQSKRQKSNVKFIEGIKKICRNKYFWIINISNTFLPLRNMSTMVVNWIWVYMLQDDVAMGFLVTVIGTASLIGMAGGPFLCKFIGKRNTVIGTNLIFLLASVALIFSTNIMWLMLVLIYIMNMMVAVQLITAPAMNGEALDYQQWKTGDRLEGFAGNFFIIVTAIQLGLNFVAPALQEFYGLTDNYDVLFDPEVRSNIFRVMAIIGIVGSIISLIPYIFWDLSEKKHKAIIEDLKARAIEEDREDGVAEDEDELLARIKGISVEEYRAEREREKLNRISAKLDIEPSILAQMSADEIAELFEKMEKGEKISVEDVTKPVNSSVATEIGVNPENIDPNVNEETAETIIDSVETEDNDGEVDNNEKE